MTDFLNNILNSYKDIESLIRIEKLFVGLTEVPMSAFQQLQQDLNDFWQLPYHTNKPLATKLKQVQAWQRERLDATHFELFNEPNNQAMGAFLINQLYGGEKFNLMAKQLTRIVGKAEKLEKFIPKNAVETGVSGVTEAIRAIKLDLQLAQYLHEQKLEVNETNMITAYQVVNAQTERYQQMQDLKAMCYRTDKYLKSFMLQKAFALAKGTAYKYKYQPLYDFIAEGFAAMRPIKSIGAFIEPFCEKEIMIIDNVHTAKPNPFVV